MRRVRGLFALGLGGALTACAPICMLSACALICMLSACALGPNYKPPTPPAGATAPLAAASPAATSPGPVPDVWWRLYDDPTLDALITQAFADNQDLQTAEHNLAASRAIYEGARSGLLPQTDIVSGATYGRDGTTDEILELSGHKPQTIWLFDSLIDVSYELDLFGHVRRSIEAARDQAQAVAAARDSLRVTIAAETARAYGSICTLGEQLDVANQALSLAARQQQIMQNRLAAGAGSQFDVVRAQVLVAQAQATLPPLQGERQASLFELAALLGETPQNAPVAVMACVQPPQLAAPLPVGDGAALLRRRPDVLEAERTLAGDTARIGMAVADFFPTVSLTGAGGTGGASAKQFFAPSSFSYQVGPLITWNFPNVLVAKAEVVQAKAQASASIAQFDGVVLNALKETEQALVTYDAELARHAALVAGRDDNQRAFDLAQIQLQRGSISFPDLLVTERNLDDAKAQLAASNQALVDDQVAVFQSLGGGWQDAPPVIPPKAP